MAQCKLTPQEFIKNTFTPQIGVMCTPLAETSCQKNNLTFIELLQPFSKLTMDLQYKDPSSNQVQLKGFKLTFLDVKSIPPQTVLARKMLNSSVSDAPEPRNKLFQTGEYELDIPFSTPWFEVWRETFLRVQYPSDHEFTKHFLACLLIVSSSDNNPVDRINQLVQNLNQMQNTTPGNLPKWFSSNVLKYYVILHDTVEGDNAVATESIETLKATYGAINCFLLKINSRPPGMSVTEHLPDPWSQFLNGRIDPKDVKLTPESSPNANRHSTLEIGQEASESKDENYHPLSPETDELMIASYSENVENITKDPKKTVTHGCCLSVDDVEHVKALVYEFSKYCLIPYIEKQMGMLNDVISNKKGMSKSLFSATKRWFSPNKPGASSIAVNNLIYSPDSAELQIRRLGDLHFMFGNYFAAFQAYHLAKRDYNTDQAWLYYAGALEMAALSAYMSNESTRKTFDYMEESITTYLNTCKMPQFATRATILSCECLKSNQMYGEAAHQLIRMTSEESDLRSALLLEQASYCFLLSKMIRKYSFHMVLAGHRFSKAAQRKHSLRCYKQAYQIYEHTTWDLASDHIHYTIGRQANNLQYFDEAVESFSKLLRGGSKQSAQQQAVFLKEYLTILENKLKKQSFNHNMGLPVLPVPELSNSSLKVLFGPTRALSTPGKIPAMGINFNTIEEPELENKWYKLEEMLLAEAEGSLPMLFKPLITLHSISTLEKNTPYAIINEPIQVSIEFVNTLQTVLHLKDIILLWEFSSDTEIISNEVNNSTSDNYVKTYVIKSAIIQGNSKQDLVLSLTPLVTGTLVLTGIGYILSGSSTTETIFIKGKKLFNIAIGTDTSEVTPITIKVVPSAPCLQVTFSEMHSDFLSGELQKISIDFQNVGAVPLQNIYMATSVPHLLTNCAFKSLENMELDNIVQRDKNARKNHTTSVPLPKGKLDSGQSFTMHIWVKAPEIKGPTSIDLLVYYENIDKNSIPRYRVIRHTWNLTVQESLATDVSFQSSYNSKEEDELALAVKATNLNKVHNSISTEITLVNIALFSKNWSLMTNVVTPKYINLNSQQSAHILLKAKRTIHKISEYSSIPLSTERSGVPYLMTAMVAFAKKIEIPLVNIFEENDNRREYKDGILLLQWQALVSDEKSKRLVNGQTHVPIQVYREEQDEIHLDRMLLDTINLSEKSMNSDKIVDILQKQVFYNLIHPPAVQHNFDKVMFCVVPVTLLLHSIVDDATLTVTINTISTSTKLTKKSNKSNLFFPHASDSFSWLSNVKIVRKLEPLRTDSVELSVAVSQPGTFDLGSHIEILCSKENEDMKSTVQSCQIHSALIVLNTVS